jgi:hypothetical protein
MVVPQIKHKPLMTLKLKETLHKSVLRTGQSGQFVVGTAFSFFGSKHWALFATSGEERGREFGCAGER